MTDVGTDASSVGPDGARSVAPDGVSIVGPDGARSAAPDGVSIVGPDGGRIALPGPTRMRILEDGSTTGHRLGIGEITIAPHTDGPPQHRHGKHDEGFYVVSGTARFTVGTQDYDAPPGTLVMVPPGAPHTFANPGDEPCVLLNTFTPDLYVTYFDEMRELIESGRPVDESSVGAVMGRYATEIVHPS